MFVLQLFLQHPVEVIRDGGRRSVMRDAAG